MLKAVQIFMSYQQRGHCCARTDGPAADQRLVRQRQLASLSCKEILASDLITDRE